MAHTISPDWLSEYIDYYFLGHRVVGPSPVKLATLFSMLLCVQMNMPRAAPYLAPGTGALVTQIVPGYQLAHWAKLIAVGLGMASGTLEVLAFPLWLPCVALLA